MQKEGKMENLTLNEITKKKLDETYVVVYAIKNEINIKKGKRLMKRRIENLRYIQYNMGIA